MFAPTTTAARQPDDLAAAILANLAGAPPVDLTEVFRAGVAPPVPAVVVPPDVPAPISPYSRMGISGLGISGLGISGLGISGVGISGITLPADSVAEAGLAAARAFAPSDREPELFCPGAVRDDPALGELVNEQVVAWAEQVGIYPGNLDRLRACNFGRYMMLAHPGTSDPDRLLAATKCLVAEWAADDYYVDEVELGADPMTVGSRLANLFAVVDPAQLPARYASDLDDHSRAQPISVAFRSAMEHLARYTSVPQMARFQQQMGTLFIAWNQEADWHANRRTPEVWEYLVQRHLNNYLPPMILIDVLAGYELPASEYYHPQVRKAFSTAGTAAVLINDLYSGPSESENDHNLITVLMAGENLGRNEAIERTVELHNELMHTFVALASDLSATGSPALRRFLADTWAWLGGSREWHATSGRYHAPSTSDE